jgi:HlyD family secretion protein
VVKRGQLLATLDMSVLNEKLYQANAALSAAQSALQLAQQTFDRTKSLFDQKAAPKTDMESATNTLSQAQTNVRNAKSNVIQSQINLSYAKIYSPIDGVILNRAVDQGQTVAASFNTPTLFLIANDLTKMEVQANMDEADVGGLAVGQKCTFTVDAYPELVFDGDISQIRLNPVTTNNVVTYTVIIVAPNPDKKLFPGMTANITVILQQEKGLVVPMGALRFTPTAEIAKLMHVQLPAQSQKGKGQGRGQKQGQGQGTHKKSQGVWIQNADGTYTHQTVEVGLNDGINAIIISGLQQGQKVVESATLAKSGNSAASNPLIPRRPNNQNQRQGQGQQGGGGGRPS